MIKILLAFLTDKFGDSRKQIAHYNEVLNYVYDDLIELAVEEGSRDAQKKPTYKIKDRTEVLLEGHDWTYSVQWEAPSEILRVVWAPDPKTLAIRIAKFLDKELDDDLILTDSNQMRDLPRELEQLLSKSDVLKDLLKNFIKVLNRDTFEYTRILLEPLLSDDEGYPYVDVDFDEDEFNEMPRDYDLNMTLIPDGFVVGSKGSKPALLERCRGEGVISWN